MRDGQLVPFLDLENERNIPGARGTRMAESQLQTRDPDVPSRLWSPVQREFSPVMQAGIGRLFEATIGSEKWGYPTKSGALLLFYPHSGYSSACPWDGCY